MRTGVSHRILAAVAKTALVLVLVPSNGSTAPATGTLAGVAVDRATGQPVPYASIMVVGTRFGATATARGEFRVAELVPGVYEVRAERVGYTPQTRRDVRVQAGEVTTVRFELVAGAERQLPVLKVFGDRSTWNVRDSDTRYVKTGEQIATLPVENVIEAVALEAGVLSVGDEIHVQGTFGRQLQVLTDGVSSSDPLTGRSLDLSTLSLADYELITGGLDAEYGNASSVLQYSTRAGGRTFEGTLNYRTDDYGRADKTFTNYDQLAVSAGGPTPFENLSYFAAGEASFQDGEFPAPRTYDERRWLGGLVKWKERADTSLRAQARLDWLLGEKCKFTTEFTLDGGRSDDYLHAWTVPGATARIVSLLVVRPNPRDREHWVIADRLTTYDGPWRERAATAVYTALSDDPGCTHCLVPLSDDSSLRVVRIPIPTASSATGATVFVLAEFPVFVGYQRPLSTWSAELAPTDTSRVAYNPADHMPSTRNSSQQLKWAFTHTLSPKSFYAVRLSRLVFDTTSDVAGKTPAEYATGGKLTWIPGRGPQTVGSADFYTDRDFPYFVTAYDFPRWGSRRTETWLLRADVSSLRFDNHKLKSGMSVQYAELDEIAIGSPGQQRRYHGPYGLARNAFRAFAPEGSVYAQDRWEHEGMVVNAGLRYDFFSVGSGVSLDLYNRDIPRVLDRWQTQWSPRLGLAFPITDRDVFHFHYGRFIQFPPKALLYASQDPLSGGTLGNPNLQPETSIAFQAGIKHQWSRDIATQLTLFNKDLYGLVSSVEVTDDSTGLQRLRYVNKSYASTRGLEVAFQKAVSHGFALDLAYTWAFAEGVSSDADFGRQAQGLSHLPTSELPLDWDQRHTFNATLTLARSGDWSATTVFQYGSGLPWSPRYRFRRRQDPLQENSRRLPSTHTVDFRGQKFFRLYGRDLRLFFDGKNLLNEKQPVALDPTFGPVPPEALPAYLEYATETGRYGGAYLHDGDGDGRDEFYPVDDPTVFGPRRLFRIGLGLEF